MPFTREKKEKQLEEQKQQQAKKEKEKKKKNAEKKEKEKEKEGEVKEEKKRNIQASIYNFFLESEILSDYLGVDDSLNNGEGTRDLVNLSSISKFVYTEYNFARLHIKNIIIREKEIDESLARYYCKIFPKFEGLKAIQLLNNTFRCKRAVFLLSNLIIELSAQLTCFGFSCYDVMTYCNLTCRRKRLNLMEKHLIVSPSFITSIIVEALNSDECDFSQIQTLRIQSVDFESLESFAQLLNKCPLLECLDLNFSSIRRKLDSFVDMFPDRLSEMGLHRIPTAPAFNNRERIYRQECTNLRAVEFCQNYHKFINLLGAARDKKREEEIERTDDGNDRYNNKKNNRTRVHNESQKESQNEERSKDEGHEQNKDVSVLFPKLKMLFYTSHPSNNIFDHEDGLRHNSDNSLDLPLLLTSFHSQYNSDRLLDYIYKPNEPDSQAADLMEEDMLRTLHHPHPKYNPIFCWGQMEEISFAGVINPYVGLSVFDHSNLTKNAFLISYDIFIPYFEDPFLATLAKESSGCLRLFSIAISDELLVPQMKGLDHVNSNYEVGKKVRPGLVSLCKDYDSLMQIITLNRNSLQVLDISGWFFLPSTFTLHSYTIPFETSNHAFSTFSSVDFALDQMDQNNSVSIQQGNDCCIALSKFVAFFDLLKSCPNLVFLRLTKPTEMMNDTQTNHQGLDDCGRVEEEFLLLMNTLADRGIQLELVERIG